jgi:hypothetical protein
MAEHHGRPDPQCPIRIGEPCRLFVPGATGPHDCSLVRLVMDDRGLREELARMRAQFVRSERSTSVR